MLNILAATALFFSDIETLPDQANLETKMELTHSERQRIHNECQFAIKKMFIALDKADREADKIKDIDVRKATRAAIEGAICGMGGRTPYAIVVGLCLGVLADITGDAYYHFTRSCDFVDEAAYYAIIADDLQERLFRNGCAYFQSCNTAESVLYYRVVSE